MANRKRWIYRGVSGVFWLLLWQFSATTVGSTLLFPPPLAVVQRVCTLPFESYFFPTISHSFFRIGGGFLLGMVIGCCIGMGMYLHPVLYSLFGLPISMIKATPVASFVILALVWISSSNLALFITFLMVVPIFAQNIYSGLRAIDPQILEMAKVYKVPFTTQIRKLYIPYSKPYFFTAIRLGIGLGWKSGIAGEVLAIPFYGIGTQLYNAKVYLETTDLFAWTVMIILISLLLEQGVLLLLGGDNHD